MLGLLRAPKSPSETREPSAFAPSIGFVAGLLPRFYVRQQRLEDERKLAQIILETGASIDCPQLVNGADGHDWQRRRGLPIVSRGVRGITPGTDPVAALLRKEARSELRR